MLCHLSTGACVFMTVLCGVRCCVGGYCEGIVPNLGKRENNTIDSGVVQKQGSTSASVFTVVLCGVGCCVGGHFHCEGLFRN